MPTQPSCHYNKQRVLDADDFLDVHHWQDLTPRQHGCPTADHQGFSNEDVGYNNYHNEHILHPHWSNSP